MKQDVTVLVPPILQGITEQVVVKVRGVGPSQNEGPLLEERATSVPTFQEGPTMRDLP
jgi:hypothetical protein